MTARPLPVNELPDTSPITCDLEPPRSAVAVGAHPDDIDFGCGATLAKWAATGCTVHYVVLTDGARGAWDPGAGQEQLALRRQEEQREAARRIGAAGVTFCGWPDGELDNTEAARWTLSRILRTLRPEVVLGHDPWRRYRLHPDHRNAGFLLTDALVNARDPLFFADQDRPAHRPRALLLWEADQPNHVERVGGFEMAKLDALLAHESQYETTMGIPEGSTSIGVEHPAAAPFRDRVLSQLDRHGALGGGRPGEAFHLMVEL